MNDMPWLSSIETHSYAYIILNEIFNRLATSEFFAGYPCKRIVQALPIEAGIKVPFIGVYQPEELYGGDGDANVGDIRLMHTVPVGIQIVLKNNDPAKLLEKLDEAYWFCMQRLLTDDSLTNFWRTTMPGNLKLESIIHGGVRERWFTANKPETPLGEKLIELALVFRSDWYRDVFDDLHRITVRTAYPEGSTPEDQLQVQQVTMVYEFDATTGDAVPFPLPDGTDPPPNPFP